MISKLMAVCTAVVVCASPSLAEPLTTRYVHPTLGHVIAVTTEVSSESSASCRISVYDAASQVKIYEDESSLPAVFVRQAHDKAESHFMHDINFDGNKEFFVQDNAAARWRGFEVYVFDSGRIRKVALEFSDIYFDAAIKSITRTISTGVASYFEIVERYRDGSLETISSKELTVEPEQ